MTERFKKAYDALVRAFFEGTLAKGTCMACACGNIIYDAIGAPVKRDELEQLISWANDNSGDVMPPEKESGSGGIWAYMRTMEAGKFVPRNPSENKINDAGYSVEEFTHIENAFEHNTRIHYGTYPFRSEEEILEDQYKGLCAVVDVLIELDEGKEDPIELKKKFREHPKLAVV